VPLRLVVLDLRTKSTGGNWWGLLRATLPLEIALWGNRRVHRMSALGQKQTCAVHYLMSALPPKADMRSALAEVR